MLRRGRPRRPSGTGLASARARFERRAMAARRRPRLLAGAVLLLVLLAGLAVWLGWFSSLLAVRDVAVLGVTGKQAAVVRQVAAVPMGVPLMRVDTDAVLDRLEANRSLKDVSVSRRLPGTIVIEGTPRVGVLAVRNPQGQVEVVDEGGVVFRTVATAPKGVPLVTAGSDQVTVSGLRAALQALRALDGTMRAEVSGMTVTAADHVTFTLSVKSGDRTVIWGGLGRPADKARLVSILLEEPGTVIDVSVPESPVTR